MQFVRTRFIQCVALAVLTSPVFLVGCEEEPAGPEVPPDPTVASVTPSAVSPGDTVRVTGTNFSATLADNTVRFNNLVASAKPFSATATRMDVVVPVNAFTGPVTVTVSGAANPGTGGTVTINHAVGEVWVYEGPSFSVPTPSPVAEYVIIPHATSPSQPATAVFNYTLSSGAAPPSPSPIASPSVGRDDRTLPERFKSHLFEEFERSAARVTVQPEDARGKPSSVATAQFRQFFVLNTTSGPVSNPASFTQVTAELRVAGTHCLVYADVDSLATGNLDQADFQSFASTYDNTFHPNNRMYFGTESDVDGNGKVIILITPQVNELTPNGTASTQGFIGGFFLLNDLFAPGQGVATGTTNHAEIFYVLAADPTGAGWGNVFPKAAVASENLKTIVHEYEHLISFSVRKFQQGNVFQRTWLEEGMAHMAEDLSGINSSNVSRANEFLKDPGAASLEDDRAGLAQRGAAYLFLRWLGDRFGDEIFKDIVQSKCTGRSCIDPITGEGFYLVAADWLATLYLSGTGINLSPRYNYQSIDLSTFQPVPVSSRAIGGTPAAGNVVRDGGDYYRYNSALTPQSMFTITPVEPGRVRVVIVRAF